MSQKNKLPEVPEGWEEAEILVLDISYDPFTDEFTVTFKVNGHGLQIGSGLDNMMIIASKDEAKFAYTSTPGAVPAFSRKDLEQLEKRTGGSILGNIKRSA